MLVRDPARFRGFLPHCGSVRPGSARKKDDADENRVDEPYSPAASTLVNVSAVPINHLAPVSTRRATPVSASEFISFAYFLVPMLHDTLFFFFFFFTVGSRFDFCEFSLLESVFLFFFSFLLSTLNCRSFSVLDSRLDPRVNFNFLSLAFDSTFLWEIYKIFRRRITCISIDYIYFDTSARSCSRVCRADGGPGRHRLCTRPRTSPSSSPVTNFLAHLPNPSAPSLFGADLLKTMHVRHTFFTVVHRRVPRSTVETLSSPYQYRTTYLPTVSIYLSPFSLRACPTFFVVSSLTERSKKDRIQTYRTETRFGVSFVGSQSTDLCSKRHRQRA